MNHINFLGALAFLFFSSVSSFPSLVIAASESTTAPHEDPDGYYTCPMHPQVHMHEKGKCPICGMPVTKVKGSKSAKTQTTETEGFELTNAQLKTIQIAKYQVESKDFVFELAVSGRAISTKEIAFQVYESDLSSLKPGLEFKGTSSFDSEKIISGKLTSIDRSIDPSSRTVRVIGRISDQAISLVLESSFHAEISNTIKNQIVVPEDAVLRAGRRDLVYVFTEQNKIQPKEVILGLKSMREYQVLSGLKSGDVISAGPNFLLDSEAKLRGAFEQPGSKENNSKPQCPEGQHWDTPMAMCMPGKASK